MRRSLLIAAALALSACASHQVTPLQATSPASVYGFATIAQWGHWESELAPVYTRLAALRHRAARALDAGRINVDTAIAIQANADRARVALDDSRRGPARDPTLLQRAQLAEAQRLIGVIEHLMEQQP